jgi:hypothetical protein
VEWKKTKGNHLRSQYPVDQNLRPSSLCFCFCFYHINFCAQKMNFEVLGICPFFTLGHKTTTDISRTVTTSIFGTFNTVNLWNTIAFCAPHYHGDVLVYLKSVNQHGTNCAILNPLPWRIEYYQCTRN